MRDVRYFTSSSIPQYFRVLDGGSPSTVGIGTRVNYRSQRGDLVTTTPYKDGTYYFPTPYEAYFHSQHVVAGETEWFRRNRLQPLNPAFFQNYRDYWGADCRAQNSESLSSLGLTPQLRPDPSFVGLSKVRENVLSQIRDTELNLGQTLRELPEVGKTIAQLVNIHKRMALSLARLLKRQYNRPVHPLYSREWFDSQDVRTLTAYVDAKNRPNPLAGYTTREAQQALDRALKRNRIYASPRKATSAVAQWYLWYIYGVKPVIQDIHLLSQAVSDGLASPQVARAYSKILDPEFGMGKGAFVETSSYRYSGKANLWLQCCVYYKVKDPTLYELWRYGLLNPASIMWETTSLSFVLDWFTGLGAFIGSLDTSIALIFDSGFETYYADLLYTHHDKTVYHNDAVLREVYKRGAREKDTTVQTIAMWRVISLTFPIPLVYVNVDLNSNQVRSLIALIAAQF